MKRTRNFSLTIAQLAFSFSLMLIPVVSVADDKPRVFITDSTSWEFTSRGAASRDFAAAVAQGGARPQTAEIMKTFGERCPEVLITNKPEKANFIVVLDHEGGKGLIRRDNKVAVFDEEGDMIYSGSTRSLGNAVKDSCNAIKNLLPSSRPAQSERR